MKSLNDSVIEYKKQLAKRDIKIAYLGLMDFMMKLRSFFKNKYPGYSVSGNMYQGYMDMTYFSLFPDFLKEKKLKIAVVLVHEKISIEVWLAGINKQIQTKYWNQLNNKNLKNYRLPSDLKGVDSIIEHTITDNPDFNDPETLTRLIDSGTSEFIKDIEQLLK